MKLTYEEVTAHCGNEIMKFIERELAKAQRQLTIAKQKNDQEKAQYYRGRHRVLLELTDLETNIKHELGMYDQDEENNQ